MGVGLGVGKGGALIVAIVALPTGVPHELQKRTPVDSSLPQLEQEGDRRVPHSPQNPALSLFSRPQLGQSIEVRGLLEDGSECSSGCGGRQPALLHISLQGVR